MRELVRRRELYRCPGRPSACTREGGRATKFSREIESKSEREREADSVYEGRYRRVCVCRGRLPEAQPSGATRRGVFPFFKNKTDRRERASATAAGSLFGLSAGSFFPSFSLSPARPQLLFSARASACKGEGGEKDRAGEYSARDRESTAE